MPRGKLWIFSVLAALLAGCPSTGDIGYPCSLVRAGEDGGTVNITESEVSPDQDVISFGVLDCENFVCIRHRYAPRSEDPNAFVQGTCSRSCTPGETCDGLYSDADLSAGPYTCRALLLDEQTIAAICASDAELCDRLFGPNRSPYFCAQGAEAPDAGT